MTGQYFLRLIDTGTTKILIFLLVFLLFFSLHIATCYAIEFSNYSYDAFQEFFSIEEENHEMEPYLYSVVLKVYEEPYISYGDTIGMFPNYSVSRKTNTDSLSDEIVYLTYSLAEDRMMLLSFTNGFLRSISIFQKRCTPNRFELIHPGITTIEEIVNIDRNTVCYPFFSSGLVSYHCLSDDSFRKLTYELRNGEFIVDSVEIVNQNECLTIYRRIFPEDLP